MRNVLSAFLVSLGAASIGCSGNSSPTSLNGGGSSGANGSSGGNSNGGSNSSGGDMTGSSSGGGSNSSGSSSGGPSGSGSSGGSSGSSSSGGSSGGTDASIAAAYPSGPYCTPAGSAGHMDVGCVLPNMTWIGYDDEAANEVATKEPYATYTLDDARKSGKRYAMINVAEFDCPGCQNSATELGATNDAGVSAGASVVQAGGLVIEVLETSGFVAIASMTDLESWVNKYSLMVTTVKDPDSSSGTPTLDQFGRRDQAYIVDLTTMKILQYIDGSIVATAGGNSAGLAMTAMHTLLGK